MHIHVQKSVISKVSDQKLRMAPDEDTKYINMRVPKTEYEKLKKAREKMQDNPDYSWVGSLALGAFIGLVAGVAIKKITESDDDSL